MPSCLIYGPALTSILLLQKLTSGEGIRAWDYYFNKLFFLLKALVVHFIPLASSEALGNIKCPFSIFSSMAKINSLGK